MNCAYVGMNFPGFIMKGACRLVDDKPILIQSTAISGLKLKWIAKT